MITFGYVLCLCLLTLETPQEKLYPRHAKLSGVFGLIFQSWLCHSSNSFKYSASGLLELSAIWGFTERFASLNLPICIGNLCDFLPSLCGVTPRSFFPAFDAFQKRLDFRSFAAAWGGTNKVGWAVDRFSDFFWQFAPISSCINGGNPFISTKFATLIIKMLKSKHWGLTEPKRRE